MNTETKIVRYVVINDHDEIASIQADGFEDIIGGQLEDGTWLRRKKAWSDGVNDNSLRRERSNERARL